MANMVIPLEIVKLLQAADWIALATRDSTGEPNVANKFLIKCEKDTVFLVDYAKGRTWENINSYPRVAFPIMDTDNLIDYQLSGAAQILDKGTLHDELIQYLATREIQFSTKRVIEGIRRERSHGSFEFPDINNAVIIKIEIDDIISRGSRIRIKEKKQ